MKKILVVTIIFAISFLCAEELDLETIIDEGIKNSESVKIDEAKAEKMDMDADSTFIQYFPTINITGQFMRLIYAPEVEPLVIPLSKLAAPSDALVEYITEQVTAQVPEGTPAETIAAMVSEEVVDAMNISLSTAPDYSRTVEIKAVQPITPLWSVYNGVKAKETGKEIFKLKKEITKDQIASTVSEYYYSYSMLSKIDVLLDESMKQLERYQFSAESLIDKGFADKTALLRINIEKARVKKEKEKVKGGKRVLKKALALLMNRDVASFEIKEASDNYVPMTTNEEDLLSLQKSKRKEFKMLKKNEEIKEEVASIELQPLIPTLALVGGYKHNWDETLIAPEGYFYLGGVASWDIGFDWYKNHKKYSMAKQDITVAKLESIEKKKQMELQVTKMFSDLKVKETEIVISENEIAEAEENLRIQEEKYKQNMTTETDLLAAHLALRKAKTSFISNKYQYSIAVNKLASTIGVPFEELR